MSTYKGLTVSHCTILLHTDDTAIILLNDEAVAGDGMEYPETFHTLDIAKDFILYNWPDSVIYAESGAISWKIIS